MLVLGTATDTPDAIRSAGPVIRACLRRAFCPVVVISVVQDQLPREQDFAPEADVDLPVRLPVGVGTGGPAVLVPAPSGMGHAGGSAKGVPVPAGA
jgi:hypothetical protein